MKPFPKRLSRCYIGFVLLYNPLIVKPKYYRFFTNEQKLKKVKFTFLQLCNVMNMLCLNCKLFAMLFEVYV